jgi:hypothetical protein
MNKKRSTNDTNIKDAYTNYLSSLSDRKKKITIIFLVIIALIFIFSLYNMFIYYKKVNLYEFSYADEEITCTNAMLLVTNNDSLFKTCDIRLIDPEEKFEYISYYTVINGNEKLIEGFGEVDSLADYYRQHNDNVNIGRTIYFSINWEGFEHVSNINKRKGTILVKVKTNKKEYKITLEKKQIISK